MEMYRFRTAYGLLDGYQELEKQEIYFASPEELNDPMEGYRDIFWKGDSIIWRNLLKNYLFSLEHIYLLTIISGDTYKVSEKEIPLFNYPIENYPPQRAVINKKVRKRFFERSVMNSLPAELEQRKNAIRRNELLSHLMFVQHFALDAIEEVYLSEGLIKHKLFFQDEATLAELILKSGNQVALYNQVEAENNETVDKLEIFFQVMNAMRQGISLSTFGAAPEKMLSNRMFILNTFNEAFINKLETLCYPDWYSASFLTNCRNSAIWAHYGDNHKGLCLVYEPKAREDDLTMEIRMQTGYNMTGPTISMRAETFQKVRYGDQHVEIDFFRSLGRSPVYFLEANWYRSETGELSPYASHLYDEHETWHQAYWENFRNSLTVKIKEWEYEQEYRLTINGSFVDYTEKDSRKLQYDFSALKGIIFGLKTAPEDKLKIIAIIQKKCLESGRTDFDFYQAYYSRVTRQIERQKLGILAMPTN